MSSIQMCQCCGMPLSKDPNGGGTNSFGSKTNIYCSYCYQKGEFTFKGPVTEFREFCRFKMKEEGHSAFKAWLYTRKINRLGRWK